MKQKESLFHVKFEREEALFSKKDILSMEVDLLKVAKSIRAYKIQRTKEVEAEDNFSKKIKSLKASVNKLQRSFPKTKIPAELRKKERGENQSSTKSKQQDMNSSVENQLLEIQKRLDELQNNIT